MKPVQRIAKGPNRQCTALNRRAAGRNLLAVAGFLLLYPLALGQTEPSPPQGVSAGTVPGVLDSHSSAGGIGTPSASPVQPLPPPPPETPSDAPDAPPAQAGSTASQSPAQTESLASSPEAIRAYLAELFLLGAREAESPRPIRLLETLRRSAERDRQEAIVKAFWDTLAAGMELGSLMQASDRLKNVSMPAQASAVATAFESQLNWRIFRATQRLRSCQYRLAASVGVQTTEGLPLPGDMFVVSEYRTYYAEAYAGRPMPVRIHQLGRTLPLRAAEVIGAAKALEAVQDFWTACAVGLAEGRTSPLEFFAATESVLAREKDLIDAVWTYNLEIAEYALGVSGGPVPADTLASMLIGKRAFLEEVAPANPSPTFPGLRASAGSASQGVAPAAHFEPIPENSSGLGSGWQKIPPASRAPVPGGESSATTSSATAKEVPTSEIQSPPPRESVSIQSTPVIPLELPPSEAAKSPLAPSMQDVNAPQGSPGQVRTDQSSPGGEGQAPFPPGKTMGSSYLVRRPVLPPEASPFCRFPALQMLEPKSALRNLVPALFQLDCKELSLPGSPRPVEVRSLSLEACLMRSRAGERSRVVRAYWELLQAWARLRSAENHRDAVGELLTALFEARNTPGVGEAYLQVRAAAERLRLTYLTQARAVVAMDYELKSIVDLPGTGELLLPSTMPHAGGYELDWERIPQEARRDPSLHALADQVKEYQESLKDAAEMLATADQAAAVTLAAFYAGKASPAETVWALELYFTAEQSVIDHLVAYNLAIAQYADRVLPPGLDSGKFVEALVPAEASGQ